MGNQFVTIRSTAEHSFILDLWGLSLGILPPRRATHFIELMNNIDFVADEKTMTVALRLVDWICCYEAAQGDARSCWVGSNNVKEQQVDWADEEGDFVDV